MKNQFLQISTAGWLTLSCVWAVSSQAATPAKLLVVSVTKGFRHSSIPTAEKALAEVGQKSGVFTVDYARTDEELAQKMRAESLRQYDGLIFANTTGDLPLPDKQAFIDWIKSGKAFVGMHSASDTFHGFPPYIEMLRGEFQAHPPGFYKVDCRNQDPHHPATRHLGATFTVTDEIYLLKNFPRNSAWTANARRASERQDAGRFSHCLVQGIRQRPGLLHLPGSPGRHVGRRHSRKVQTRKFQGDQRGLPETYSGRHSMGARPEKRRRQ